MRRRLAALLRRWADRLDPLPVTRAPTAAPVAISGGEARHQVTVEGVPVYDGPLGARARDAFVSAVRSKREVEYVMDGEVRDWWPRES